VESDDGCPTALWLSVGFTAWVAGLSSWAAVLTKLGLIRPVLETFVIIYYKGNLTEMDLRSTILFNDVPELAGTVKILIRPVVGPSRYPLSATDESIRLQLLQIILDPATNRIRILLLRVSVFLYDKGRQLRRGPFCRTPVREVLNRVNDLPTTLLFSTVQRLDL
jgi:hypothetical protein